MSQNNEINNSIKVYTSSEPGGLSISAFSNINKTLDITNNRAQYYSDLAKKYKEETKGLMETTKLYAEQNSDVTKLYVDGLVASLEREIDGKQDADDYAKSSDLPTKVSDLTNDAGYITTSSVGNGTITLNQNNQLLGTFSANQSTNTTINIPYYSRNIGEVVASTIPLTDAGLHLLDGALINGNGSYSAFVDYIADLYNSGDYTAIFDTEANWQTAVNTFGVCGKFVYDSVNNTVRLPKYNSEIYTGGGTAPVKGNGITLGLTDGNSLVGLQAADNSINNALTVYTGDYGTNVGSTQSGTRIGANKTLGITTDASKSGIISDLANITTSVDCYYYIVVAISTKTEIEVDIDEIATDVNGKADVDLTNLNNQAKVLMSGMALPSSTYDDLTLGASGTTYTAPANGYYWIDKASSGNSQYIDCVVKDSNNTSKFTVSIFYAYSSVIQRILVPVLKNDKLTISYTAGGATNYFRFIYAKGSESEAS